MLSWVILVFLTLKRWFLAFPIHFDVQGPSYTLTTCGSKYFGTSINDFSLCTWVFLLNRYELKHILVSLSTFYKVIVMSTCPNSSKPLWHLKELCTKHLVLIHINKTRSLNVKIGILLAPCKPFFFMTMFYLGPSFSAVFPYPCSSIFTSCLRIHMLQTLHVDSPTAQPFQTYHRPHPHSLVLIPTIAFAIKAVLDSSSMPLTSLNLALPFDLTFSLFPEKVHALLVTHLLMMGILIVLRLNW
ncbi:hypothetical protein CR513_61983, partial [Mucuna pruriens]